MNQGKKNDNDFMKQKKKKGLNSIYLLSSLKAKNIFLL
jgi:hypothetical protein